MIIPWYKRIYALYKGEQFVADGTLQEISEATGKSVDFLKYMTYPIYEKRCRNGKNRLAMVLLDDEQ